MSSWPPSPSALDRLRPADSYLNQSALLTAAKATGCDGIHPGYGFLSENADFADLCVREGITFIGPSGDTIRKAGSKSAARDLMRRAGVPVTPGSDGPVDTVEQALIWAERVGYPVLLKGLRWRGRPGHPPMQLSGGAARRLSVCQGGGPGLLRRRPDVSGKADPAAPPH